MDRLPDDVEAALTRSVGSYLRATSATELPSALRRYQGFRPKALLTHKKTLLDALDDDAFRARVGEWLDDKPSLAAAEAELLRIAVRRDSGWIEELVGRGANKQPARKPTDEGRGEVERERAKARRARADARRHRQQTDRELQTLQARVGELEQTVRQERARSDALWKELAAARSELERASARAEREERKTRARLEKAQEAAADVRTELKEARKKVQTLSKELERAKKPAAKKTSARKPQPATGPRRPLAIPKGRFDDDPQTLEVWLAAPDVHLLVDGYNASMSELGFGNLHLEGQRKRLIDELTKLARRTKAVATIVFDGSDVPPGTRRGPRGPVKVRYSAPDQIADDLLIALLETMPPTPVVVATNDRELQERSRALGATIATSDQLLGLLR